MSPFHCLSPLLFCCTLAHAATDWRAAAQQDMQFAIDTIERSHAGAVSGQREVLAALRVGARAGVVEAPNVVTEQDYKRAMVRLIDSFGDPHTGIDVRLKTVAWTGLVLEHVGGDYRVAWSEPQWPHPLPPRGARVQSCDGVWIGAWLQTNVAPFINHSAEYATSASEAAKRSMFESGLGWTPGACSFMLADGSRRHYQLPLRSVAEVGAARMEQLDKQVHATGRPVGLYPLAAGMQWVAMPDFDGRASGAAYEKLYAQLAAMKTPRWIVFDLRGNGGGDSTWGNRALQALYGKDDGARLDAVPTYAKRMVADQATVDVFRRFAGLPQFAAAKGELEAAIPKLEGAVQRGEKMAVLEDGTAEQATALAAQLRRRPGGPRIAAVIDRGCFSSCMNFVQQIRALSDTVLLGEPTLGYSPYGEINQFKLPSGHGAISLPSAIYSSLQAPREPFVPDLFYPGDMADEPALMQWVAASLRTQRAPTSP
jgi:hypothetical protein